MSAAGGPASNLSEHELRRSPRLRTFLGGKIVFQDGAYSYNCIVRDMSDAGARVEISGARLIPRRFFFLTSREVVAYESELIWRTQRMAGLKFRTTIQLATCKDPNLSYLKQVAAELCPDVRR